MRRAIVLITVLGLLCFGSGIVLDRHRYLTARQYMAELEQVRLMLLDERWQDAKESERLLSARWQHDQQRLKLLISHHHTREVSSALLQLSTAIEQKWMDEALPAVDDAHEALHEIAHGHLPTLENVI